MYYSASTGGFYTLQIHGSNIPEDAVEISLAGHAALLNEQSLGKVIQADDTGNPVAIEPPAPTIDQLRALKSKAIDKACRDAIYAGFQSTALGNPHTYPANDKDQANLIASVTESLYPSLPTNWVTPFWSADVFGEWAYRPHTAAQIQEVGSDGKAAIVAALTRNAILQAQIAAADEAGLEAIEWDES